MGENQITIDAVGVAERVKRFQSRSIKTASKLDALKLALSMVDLTTLEGADTPGKVRQLCRKGIMPDPSEGIFHLFFGGGFRWRTTGFDLPLAVRVLVAPVALWGSTHRKKGMITSWTRSDQS